MESQYSILLKCHERLELGRPLQIVSRSINDDIGVEVFTALLDRINTTHNSRLNDTYLPSSASHRIIKLMTLSDMKN